MPGPSLDSSLSFPVDSVSFRRIADTEPRHRSTICGMVVRVKTKPAGSLPSFEVAIEDPSGTAYAIWLGRRSLRGISLGRRLLLEGVASASPRGLVYVNPSYRLLPEH